MEALFLKLLNMSIAAGWMVLAVVLLRLVLKKAPRALFCLLWGLVGIRLVCPFTLESVLSLVPSGETLPPDMIYSPSPTINTGITVINSAVNPVISENLAPAAGDSANPLQIITAVAAAVWAVGVAAMLVYSLVSYLKLRKTVGASINTEGNIWICDDVKSPFILGIFRPRIYLPSDMDGESLNYVIAHENAHLLRRDHLWKPIGFVLLSVYWFNPLMWLAYILLCRDIESACDEKVVKGMDTDAKKGYSEALLACSVNRRAIMACPLAFGEVGVKDRIKGVLNYKKPTFWLVVAATVASVALAVGFLTDPPKDYAVLGETYNFCPEVGIEITELALDAEEPYMTVKFYNNGTGGLWVSQKAKIYRHSVGKKISCYDAPDVPQDEVTIPHSISMSVEGKEREIKFDLSDYDVSRNGYYTAELGFSYYEQSGLHTPFGKSEDYTATVVFEVVGGWGIAIRPYALAGAPYTDLSYVHVMITELALDKKESYITVEYINNSGAEISEQADIGVYRHVNGQKINCSIYGEENMQSDIYIPIKYGNKSTIAL